MKLGFQFNNQNKLDKNFTSRLDILYLVQPEQRFNLASFPFSLQSSFT